MTTRPSETPAIYKPISDERLDELSRLSMSATSGPWTKGRSFESVIAPSAPDPRGDAPGYGGALVAESVYGPGDLAFIATAREAVPSLVAEVRRLQAREAELVSQLQDLPR